MNKKFGLFFIGSIIAILVIYIIPILIIYPNIKVTSKNGTNPAASQEYIVAADKIKAANLEKELNAFNSSITDSLKDEINIRNYIIIFYAIMLFISICIIAMFCIKSDINKKPFGEGLILGNVVGLIGFMATIIINSSYFII